MKGIILAAGSGRRLYPLTKGIPKALLPVYDKPMIYYALEFMNSSPVDEVIVVINKEHKDVFAHALNELPNINFTLTFHIQEQINGTAGALKQMIDKIDDDIILYYGDNILQGVDISSIVQKGITSVGKGNAVVLALRVANPSDYGVLEIDAENKIRSIEEKPLQPKSNFIAPGIYFYPRNVTDKLEKIKVSPRGEYEMTSALDMYLQEGKLEAIKLSDEALWFDTGNFDALLDAANIIRKREANRHEGIY